MVAAGVALLIACEPHVPVRRSVAGGPLSHGPAFRSVAEALASSRDWRVTRFDLAAMPRSRGALELELDGLGRRGRVALVAVLGSIVVTEEGPAIVLVGEPGGATLPLAAIAARVKSCGVANAVLIAVSSSGGTPLGWRDALDTGRPGDLIVAAAKGTTEAVLHALHAGLSGTAFDLTTGAVTLRSFGSYLALQVSGLAIRGSTEDATLISPPPLAGAWDPRLTRRSLTATDGPTGVADVGRSANGTEPDDLTGMVLPGRFRLDALIARGGFGAVYRARQLSVDRDVAVKVLGTALEAGSQGGRLFVQEIHSVGRIDHPNVVRVLQADVTPGGRLFFAMELLAGRDLEQIAAGGPLPAPRAIALTRQLLAGLGAAHDAGLVHADIKPANAIVVPTRDGDERVVLVDFGLSRLRAPDQPVVSIGGTPSYMAPEQLRNGRVDARSDVFSAALVLVTLLTGWRRRSYDELVPPLDGVSDPRLRDLLGLALSIDPAERMPTAAALASALAGGAAPLTGPVSTPAARPFSVAALTERDAARLFGRDRDLAALLDLVLERPVVVVSGPMGAGKTSLLRAGLLPRLAAHGACGVLWAGGDLEALIERFDRVVTGDSADFAALDRTTMSPEPARARWAELDSAVARCGRRVVIVVDPFEAVPGDDPLLDWLASPGWPDGLDVSVVVSRRNGGHEDLAGLAHSAAATLAIGGLDRPAAREVITGLLAESRMGIEPALMDALLDALGGPAAGGGVIDPTQLQRICAGLYDALPADDAVLTLALYGRLGGAAAIVGGAAKHSAPSAPARSIRWLLIATALVVAAAAIVILGVIRRAGPSSPEPSSGTAAPRPAIVIGGSGTVLWGFLSPVRDGLERRSGVAIPLSEKLDTGSGGAMRLLAARGAEVIGMSARYERELPPPLRTDGRLVVEVAIGFDETALFVHRDNPLDRVDISVFRNRLCCARGHDTSPSMWSELGLAGSPLSTQPIQWILFGRNSTPRPGDTSSATLVQADTWFCGAAQLCAATERVEAEAQEILTLLARTPGGLALSSRSFATPEVRRITTVDGVRRTRLSARKALWLYFAADRARPAPDRLCRFLATVLDAETARQLGEAGKVDGLDQRQRERQRAALGLDDGRCAAQQLSELVGDGEAGIVRAKVDGDVEGAARWIAE